MPVSSTVIIALRYRDGVLICSDSQATDDVAGARWSTQKLSQVQTHPVVFGHSGSLGSAQRVDANLEELVLHQSQFEKRTRLQKALDKILIAEHRAIAERSYPPSLPDVPSHDIRLWSLAAVWAEGKPQIIEYEINGESSWHENFHAIGSGAQTAYAVYATLGSSTLCNLRERSAIIAALRILRTVVAVEPMGVSDPYDIWRIRASGARRIRFDEINAHMQYTDEWIEEERQVLVRLDATA